MVNDHVRLYRRLIDQTGNPTVTAHDQPSLTAAAVR
jgi:hypothetical protein